MNFQLVFSYTTTTSSLFAQLKNLHTHFVQETHQEQANAGKH